MVCVRVWGFLPPHTLRCLPTATVAEWYLKYTRVEVFCNHLYSRATTEMILRQCPNHIQGAWFIMFAIQFGLSESKDRESVAYQLYSILMRPLRVSPKSSWFITSQGLMVELQDPPQMRATKNTPATSEAIKL